MFSALGSCTDLVFAINLITTIEIGAFNGLTSLQCLDLEANPITRVDGDAFARFSTINRFLCGSTQTQPPCQGIAPNCNSTCGTGASCLVAGGLNLSSTSTFLCSAPCTVITAKGCSTGNPATCDGLSLTVVPCLNSAATYVYLNSNKITSVPANAFLALSSCTLIFLYDNIITTIDVGAFNGLTRLQRL